VDVWWESGVSHTSVLEAREELQRPAEMYLEGSDQHRGWFQSSLLTSVGAYGVAPFERVLTHGFIVDGDGRKMSKSLGNVISPLDVIKKSGADIIRLWVASADYGQDVSVSDEILDRTSEAYRRIRNTFRFLLSNLYDYDPAHDVAWDDMPALDRFALEGLSVVLTKITRHYDEWRFHMVYRTILDYVGDLSAVYLDVVKDRLYADAADSTSRRSAQTVLARILGVLVRVLAPVLSFTCEEVWGFMPESLRDAESVQLTEWPEVELPAAQAAAVASVFAVVLQAREVANAALELARAEKTIGKSQEASIKLTVSPREFETLSAFGEPGLAELLIVSEVQLDQGADDSQVIAEVGLASGEKCPRCWNHRVLGADPAYPEVCSRCASVLALHDV
jgi:isoleucyl-tRNA synthetase